MTALRCSNLDAGYHGLAVVRSVDFHIEEGEVVALLGPNGAGKTTLLNTLAGLLPRLEGTVDVLGTPAPSGNATAVARRGLALVPDDRALFTTLTARENIELARRKGAAPIADILDLFPGLAPRLDVRVGVLSGGEQQMVAMARALVQRPRVLLIDELSMGLAPVIVEALLPVVRRAASETGAAVLLVEQHVRLALEVADRAVVMVHGELVLSAPAAELRSDLSIVERAYLGEQVRA
jgi:branched-chain amino acid transport system ATP-binding protein